MTVDDLIMFTVGIVCMLSAFLRAAGTWS